MRFQLAHWGTDLADGDVLVSNHPQVCARLVCLSNCLSVVCVVCGAALITDALHPAPTHTLSPFILMTVLILILVLTLALILARPRPSNRYH